MKKFKNYDTFGIYHNNWLSDSDDYDFIDAPLLDTQIQK